MIPKVLFLVNTLEELLDSEDTTGCLLRATAKYGLRCFAAPRGELRCVSGAPWVRAWSGSAAGLEPGNRGNEMPLDEFQLVHIRFDPPVESDFVEAARLLAIVDGRIAFANPPSLVATFCEKLLPFSEIIPRSIVTRSLDDAAEFGQLVGRTVIKPLNDACGRGVELLDWQAGRAEARQNLERALRQRPTVLMVQEFLPQVLAGETRSWMLDGIPIGWLRKTAADGDFRFNRDRGDAVTAWDPTPSELKAIDLVGPWLRSRGVRLAAVDMIAGQVIDVNVTSPGLLVELERVTGVDIAGNIVRKLAPMGPK